MPQVTALTTPAPIGGTVHKRATVTNTAGTLASFLSGSVLPTFSGTDAQGGTITLQPTGVSLGIESAESTSKVYWTVDGQTPTATLGCELPALPSLMWFPLGQNGLSNLKLLGSAATVHVQCVFEYNR